MENKKWEQFLKSKKLHLLETPIYLNNNFKLIFFSHLASSNLQQANIIADLAPAQVKFCENIQTQLLKAMYLSWLPAPSMYNSVLASSITLSQHTLARPDTDT